MSGPYARLARRYRDAGFPVVPIQPGDKCPSKGLKWSDPAIQRPDDRKFAELLRRCGKHGIGIPTGWHTTQSGLLFAVVDVDADYLSEVSALILGNPICGKRGARGISFFALAEPHLKSTSIKTPGGAGAIDILVQGKMTVIPDTIHPTTGRPYEWVGKELLECKFDELPVLR